MRDAPFIDTLGKRAIRTTFGTILDLRETDPDRAENVWTPVTVRGDYTLTKSKRVLLVDAAPGALMIQLPVASNHVLPVFITRIGTSTATVTVRARGTDTINGSATLASTTARESFMLQPISDGWVILAHYTP